MPRIQETIEIKASRDRVWEIISDLDNEPEYWWGTQKVKTLSKNGNVIKREIYQKFGGRAIVQKVILKPRDEIEIQYLEGITQGVKYLRLDSANEETQQLAVKWDVHFLGIYRLVSPLIVRHVRQGTKDALQRIKGVSEGRTIKKLEEPVKKSSAR